MNSNERSSRQASPIPNSGFLNSTIVQSVSSSRKSPNDLGSASEFPLLRGSSTSPTSLGQSSLPRRIENSVGKSSSTSNGSSNLSEFGLIALLKLIRMSDDQRNALALGQDPTLLGWNGDISTFFSTPARKASAPDSAPLSASLPQPNGTPRPPSLSTSSSATHLLSTSKSATSPLLTFQLPPCYLLNQTGHTVPSLKTGHFEKFTLETLMYIFYAFAGDILQAYAAQELYQRQWRYHSEHKLWFQKIIAPDDSSEDCTFVYFDLSSWDRAPLYPNQITTSLLQGLLSEQEVRLIKPTTPSASPLPLLSSSPSATSMAS